MTEQQGWPTQHIPPQPAPPHVPQMQRPFGPAAYPAPPYQPAVPMPDAMSAPMSAPMPAPVRPRRRLGLTIAAAFATVALAGGSAVAGGYAALELRPDSAQVTSAAAGSTATKVDPASLASVAAAVLPSVVSIQTGQALGSGVVLNAAGAILTNNHVVATAQGNTVQVTFSSGKTATATIVGTDATHDLAVIKVSGVSGLTPVTFGDSSALHVGDTVLAVGSPLGLDGSVTSGIVSALNRTINAGEDASSTTTISGAIQTDAAINPGNSGGALVNSAGQLIGINTAIATASDSGQSGNIGVGFAISSNTAKQVAQQLLS
jgi:putative serine protease PepD